MGLIADSIHIYEELRQHSFTIKAEGGMVFSFSFLPENYHHLAGFQHLADVAGIAEPRFGSGRFYRLAKSGKINEAVVTNSVFFARIEDRLKTFAEIKNILYHSNEMIVDFDPSLAQSDIAADFFLYRWDGDLLKGPYTYYHLFLGHDQATGIYYPATYIVEPTKQYISGQKMLTCEIIIQ